MLRVSGRGVASIAMICLVLLAATPSSSLGQQAAPCPGLPNGQFPEWRLDQHPELADMAPTIRSILEDSRVSYRGPRGAVEGFIPGPIYSYPEGPVAFYIYGRDTATIVPMARYYVPAVALRSVVEEFARLQYTDATVSADGDLNQPVGAGALSATISPDFRVNKATITSDEEPSVILTAAHYYRTSGDVAWLETELDGQTLIDRLNEAMEWLIRHRWEEGVDLIKRGHTTDWGDVKMEDAPQPTDISVHHVWTYSIYDQALTFAALRGLAEMNLALGRSDLSQRYLRLADTLRESTDARLWMPERVYYRIHLHATYTSAPHEFDEDAIISIGNAAAVYYGLATGARVGSIVERLEAARVVAGAPKAGLTLFPAYPNGEFIQINMSERRYQNGALWDWWAGRQITAEYESGFSRFGDAHLMQLALDWSRHPGEVFEWESPWTDARSLDNRYAGAASVVGEAVVRGLFGITLRHGSLEIAPRLTSRDGAIGLTDIANGTRVAYAYAYDDTSRRIDICYETTFDGPISVRPLLPAGLSVRAARLDDVPVNFATRVINEDRYALVVGAEGSHRVTLELAPTAP